MYSNGSRRGNRYPIQALRVIFFSTSPDELCWGPIVLGLLLFLLGVILCVHLLYVL